MLGVGGFVGIQAKRVKAIMLAAAELAALRLQDLPSGNQRNPGMDQRDRVFLLLDKNGDGKISIEELMEVMEELGAQGDDAREMMLLLDSNSDGSLSSDEFGLFQKQVCVLFQKFLLCKPNEIDVEISQHAPFLSQRIPLLCPPCFLRMWHVYQVINLIVRALCDL